MRNDMCDGNGESGGLKLQAGQAIQGCDRHNPYKRSDQHAEEQSDQHAEKLVRQASMHGSDACTGTTCMKYLIPSTRPKHKYHGYIFLRGLGVHPPIWS
eukprot:2131737-Pleurochrysis_carterae.AAC.1